MHGFNDRWWTSSDGLRLYARDYAAGEGAARLPVIAIHGLTRNSADFGDVASAIAADGRRVLAVDVRGRGLSDRASDPMTYQPPHYAADIAALMEQAGIGRAVFLGTSMGGLIAMALAVLKPKLAAAAILNDVGPELSPVGLARIAGYAGQPTVVTSWADAAAYARRNNGAALPHYTNADWDAFARRTFKEGPDGVPALNYDPDIGVPIRRAGARALAPSLWPFFGRLAKGREVLLIRGANSDLLDAKVAEKMRRKAPHMAYAEVPGVGHAPMLDEPAARDAIATFLARVA